MNSETAFVTGASRGIGRAITEELARAGYRMAVNSRNEYELTKYADYISRTYHTECLPLAGDVSDFSFIEEALARIKKIYGNLGLLVNNAGISHIGLLTDMSLEEWMHVLNVNLTSAFSCCKFAIPQMLEKKSGSIINISSVWGVTGASCEVAYSASKGGLNAFTRALAKELAPSNIAVNAIACGVIDTDMNRCFTSNERDMLEEEIPAGRFGRPEEAAKLVLSIAKSPSYLTGQVISLDGGWQ